MLKGILFIALFCNIFLFPQSIQISEYSIKAVIIDSSSLKPVVLANFVLLNKIDSSLVGGAVSDKNGFIVIEKIVPGNYFEVISYVGYKKRIINDIEVKKGVFQIQLDTIYLSPLNILLGEVRVTSEKERVLFLDDRIILNVDKDIFSFGGTALEVLENAPLINVDINGTVSLVGNKRPLICMDGVPLKDMGMDINEFLLTTPSADIERIEIIIEPSNEYGVEASQGVVNIILKKNTDTKYSGSLIGNANTNNYYSTSASFSYSFGKSTLRAMLGGDYLNKDANYEMSRFNVVDGQQNNLFQKKSSDNIRYNKLMRISYLLMPDKENILNQMVSYKILNNSHDNEIINQFTDSTIKLIEYNNILSSSDVKTTFFNYFLSYKRSFKEKRNLSLTFTFTNNLMKLESVSGGEKILLNTVSPLDIKSSSSNKNTSYFFRAFYSHLISKESSFLVGNNINLKILNLQNNYLSLGEIIKNNNFRFKEFNYDLYPSYSSELFGLKYSITGNLNWKYLDNREKLKDEHYKYNYWGIYPSITISKLLHKHHKITINGSSGVFHPYNREINPHIDYTDSSNLNQGNPDLKPSTSKSVNVGYVFNNLSTTITTGFGYHSKHNIIEPYTFLLDERTTMTTYRNIGKSYFYSAYIDFQESPFQWWNFNAQINFYYRRYSNPEYSHKGIDFSSEFQSRINYQGFAFQFKVEYSPGSITIQSKKNETIFADIAARANLYDNKLYLFLKVNDVFNSIKNNLDVQGIGYLSRSSTSETTRIISLGLSYFFKATENPEEDEVQTIEDDF